MEPIGTLSVFTGRDSWGHYFARAGSLERVYYSQMTPLERAFIRSLVHWGSLSYPLYRFRTVNTRQYGLSKVGRDGHVVRVPNADYGAVNIFLYLGDNPELGRRVSVARAGQLRRGRLAESRSEVLSRRGHVNRYFQGCSVE